MSSGLPRILLVEDSILDAELALKAFARSRISSRVTRLALTPTLLNPWSSRISSKLCSRLEFSGPS